MPKILRCSDRFPFGDRRGFSSRLYVLDENRQNAPRYLSMCEAIEDAIHAKYLEAVLGDIAKVESGLAEVIEEETEGWLFLDSSGRGDV